MRCLVTGASGHVGSFVVRRLLAEGADVFAMVRAQSDLWRLADIKARINLVYGDLDDIGAAESELLAIGAQTVFHLAWYGVTGGFRNERDQILKNVPGTLELFRIAQDAGCHCWVGVGSQAEYGLVDGLLREDIPSHPETAYGVAKDCVRALTEKLCTMSEGMRFLWFRLLATYGPMDDPRHLLPTVIESLLNKQQPSLTPGEQRWDYLYVEDAADAIVSAVFNSNAEGIYNLGSGRAETVRSLVERVRDLIDPSLPLGFGETPYRHDQVMLLQADIRKLQETTGWAPQTNLDSGLRQTVDWHQAQRITALP